MNRSLIALRGLVFKELREVRADPRIIFLLMVAPMVQLMVFGYAATLDVATARMLVVDQDHSPQSRTLAQRMGATGSFELVGTTEDPDVADHHLSHGSADLALMIPPGYGRDLARGEATSVQLVIDGTDSTSASISVAAAGGLIQRLSAERAGDHPLPITVRTRVFYNPDLRSRIFMVPGVLAMVLLIVTMVATSMAIVREKELGTLEQLVVTPVSRSVLLAGKLIPFALFGAIDTFIVLAICHFWFRVPFRGSLLFLLATVPFYLASTLGLGLVVSTISRTQQQAMMTATFLVMLPMIYLSGFVFPIESMPAPVQPLTQFVPLRHFLVILRGVMLKGAGPELLWPSVARLAALGAGIFGLAIAMFQKRID